MAYLKIFPIKVTDKKILDYITNPDKTDEKLLVSSFGCSPETADLEFSMIREMAKKNGMDKGDNLAFHLIQSFKPGEVDAENCPSLRAAICRRSTERKMSVYVWLKIVAKRKLQGTYPEKLACISIFPPM